MSARKYIGLLTKEMVILAESCIKKNDLNTLREIYEELEFRKRKPAMNLKKKIGNCLEDSKCGNPPQTNESIEEYLD